MFRNDGRQYLSISVLLSRFGFAREVRNSAALLNQLRVELRFAAVICQ